MLYYWCIYFNHLYDRFLYFEIQSMRKDLIRNRISIDGFQCHKIHDMIFSKKMIVN